MKVLTIKHNEDSHECLIDDDCYAIISRHSWRIIVTPQGKTYVFTEFGNRSSTRKMVYMHQLVLGSYSQIDHINGNTLDNRAENLRPATWQQNGWNSCKRMVTCTGKPPSSLFKGVSKYKNAKGETLWSVLFVLTKKGERPVRHYRKAGFKTEIEAARHYNEEVVKYRGEYALLNQIPDYSQQYQMH